MARIVTFLVMALSCWSALAADVRAEPCSGTKSHVDQRSCLEALYKSTGARLARAEHITLAKLTAWDQDPDYRANARAALLRSNAAFRAYRSSACDYAWSLAAGGNGATDRRLTCAIELSEDRIKQLADAAQTIQPR